MKKIISALFFMTLAGIYVASAKWAPVGDKIKTRWAQDVTPENV